MSFYVWDTPEVAKHFGKDTYDKMGVYTTVDGINFIYHYIPHLNGFARQLQDISVEYKLHPVHGFIPANSKLFNEDSNKEQEEKQMKQQETKKVFEVGDKCIIKNINNCTLMEEAKKYFIDKECKIVAKFELSIPMVVVQLVAPEDPDLLGVCVVFREEMCYPVKTEKEKALEEMEHIICSVKYVPPSSSLEYEVATKLYEAGYRKVGE